MALAMAELDWIHARTETSIWPAVVGIHIISTLTCFTYVWLHIQQARDQQLQTHPLCLELYASAHKSMDEGGSNFDSKVLCIDLQWEISQHTSAVVATSLSSHFVTICLCQQGPTEMYDCKLL